MNCPHCRHNFNSPPTRVRVGEDDEGHWGTESFVCPGIKCHKVIVYLISGQQSVFNYLEAPDTRVLVRPKGATRPMAPPQVPDPITADYNEAALVLSDSPKASAALSRRCLQATLREAAGVKGKTLWAEIEAAESKVPSYLADQLHALREIGNFAAHPAKSEHSGEIIEVEPGEAEWNLDVLEGLFDFFYVQPAKAAERKAALNAKLRDAGKSELD